MEVIRRSGGYQRRHVHGRRSAGKLLAATCGSAQVCSTVEGGAASWGELKQGEMKVGDTFKEREPPKQLKTVGANE